jgi:hypothetical protein
MGSSDSWEEVEKLLLCIITFLSILCLFSSSEICPEHSYVNSLEMGNGSKLSVTCHFRISPDNCQLKELESITLSVKNHKV